VEWIRRRVVVLTGPFYRPEAVKRGVGVASMAGGKWRFMAAISAWGEEAVSQGSDGGGTHFGRGGAETSWVAWRQAGTALRCWPVIVEA
jgi:hypothetical protein